MYEERMVMGSGRNPDWLQDSHRGWIMSKFLDKGVDIVVDKHPGKISLSAARNKVVTTNSKVSSAIKSYIDSNFGIPELEASWHNNIKDVTVFGDTVLVKTNLHLTVTKFHTFVVVYLVLYSQTKIVRLDYKRLKFIRKMAQCLLTAMESVESVICLEKNTDAENARLGFSLGIFQKYQAGNAGFFVRGDRQI